MDRLFGLDNPAHADEGLVLVGTYFDNERSAWRFPS